MKNMINVESNTVLHFDKTIGGYIVELIEKEHLKLKKFCNEEVCNIQKNVLKDSNKAVKDLNSLGNSISKVKIV